MIYCSSDLSSFLIQNMVQFTLTLPIPTSRTIIEEQILPGLQIVNRSIVLISLDEDEGIARFDGPICDDSQYQSLGDLFHEWLQQEYSPILTFAMIRGPA
jgi:hypothetical protein